MNFPQSTKNQLVVEERLRPFGDAAIVDQKFINLLGFKPIHYTKVIAQRYGTQFKWIPYILDQIRTLAGKVGDHSKESSKKFGGLATTKYIKNDEIRSTVGSNIMFPGVTLECMTPDSVGQTQIQLRVGIQTGQATKANFNWWRKDQMLYSRGNVFQIIDVQNDSAGQLITIRPTTNGYQMKVVGGQSVDFPTGKMFGDNGIFKGVGGCNCQQSPEMRIITDRTYLINNMSKQKEGIQYPADIMSNHLITMKVGEVATSNIDGVPGNYEPVYGFMTELEEQTIMRMMATQNWNILYGLANTNPDVYANKGRGIVPSIPNELRFFYEPGSLTYTFLSACMSKWTSNGQGYVSRDTPLVALCGTVAWEELQPVLGAVKPQQIVRSPNETFELAGREYVVGEIFKGFHTILGYDVVLVHLPALDELTFTGQQSPVDASKAITTHDIIILDPGFKRNFDVQRMAMKDEGEYKIQIYSRENLDGQRWDFFTQLKPGRYDGRGNKLDIYQVDSDCFEIDFESNYCANFEDSYGAIYISLLA